ncbi:hypothetical protein [Nitrospina watsonii]|uniref:Uncharacterized protein n=1 Tax=Nitrospina watsonii TaxID=1323948 RepID=A0ABN8VYI8_9BACT|nr:hypothetical protein [Nitrospina watsonii]CAI2716936.1 conserved protein of unknown function [Nitrospina watsonii]
MAQQDNQSRVDELKVLKQIEIIKAISDIFHALIKFGAILGCVFFVAQSATASITALAGKESIAYLQLMAELNINRTLVDVLFFIFGAGGVTYGIRSERFRRKDVERLTTRIKKLEELLDPNRTSSGLDPTGQNIPGD